MAAKQKDYKLEADIKKGMHIIFCTNTHDFECWVRKGKLK